MADSEGTWQIGTDTASAIALTDFGQWSPTDGDPDNDLWSLADASIRPVGFRALKRGITQLAEIADGTRSVLALDVTGTMSAASATFAEAATVPGGAPSAGTARLWVKSDTPNTLYFTDDAGTDWLVAGTGSVEDLADTLTAGNTTGGTDLEVSNGDSIVGEDGGSISFAASTGLITTTTLCAGDPGAENGGITVSGSTYQSSLKVSDLGGSHAAQFILHRHSTTLPPILVGARSHSDDDTHAIVQDGDGLFGVYAVGWDGVDYAFGGYMAFEVDGTPGSNDMPTRFVVSLSPDGTQTLTERLTISPAGAAVITGTLAVTTSVQAPLVVGGDYGTGTGAGTALTVRAGDGGSTGGVGAALTIRGGNALSGATAGGAVQVAGGDSTGSGASGSMTVKSGDCQGSTGNASNVILASGTVNSGTLGVVQISNTCLEIAEAAAVPGATIGAGYGRFWVENTAPSRAKFTDDTNASHTVALIGQFTTFQNFTSLYAENVAEGLGTVNLVAGGLGFPTSTGQIVAVDWVDYAAANIGSAPSINGYSFGSVAGAAATLGINSVTIDLDTSLSSAGDNWLFLMQTTTAGVVIFARVAIIP